MSFRMLLISSIMLAGCLQAATTADDHRATADDRTADLATPDSEATSSATADVQSPRCAISLCGEDNVCPACAGTAGTCDASGICRYPGTGGPGGAGGPHCNARVCDDASQCACPSSPNPQCINSECVY